MTNISLITNILHYEVYVLFIAIFFIFLINLNEIKRYFGSVSNRTWKILLAIFIFSLIVKMVPMHSHLMYQDEASYGIIAKNMLLHSKPGQSYYSEPENINYYWTKNYIGWSFMIEIAYFLFGVNDFTALYLTSFIGALTTFLIFFFTYLLFKKEELSLLTAFFMSILPLHHIWSGASDTSVFAFFMLLSTLTMFIIYIKTNSLKIHLLAVLILSYTIQTKNEYIFLIPIIWFSYLLFMPRFRLFNFDLIKPWIILIAIIPFYIPQFLQSYSGLFKTYSYFSGINFGSWLLNYTENQPVIFLVFLIIGLFVCLKNNRKSTVFLISLYVTFMVFYTLWDGQNKYKFFMINYLCIILFQSKGILLLRDYISRKSKRNWARMFILLIIATSLFSSYFIGKPYWKFLNENEYILSTRIPGWIQEDVGEECYITTTYNDAMILTSGTFLKVILTHDLRYINKNKLKEIDCLMYYEGMACNGIIPNTNECTFVHNKFNLSLYKKYTYGASIYRLYNVSIKE